MSRVLTLLPGFVGEVKGVWETIEFSIRGRQSVGEKVQNYSLAVLAVEGALQDTLDQMILNFQLCVWCNDAFYRSRIASPNWWFDLIHCQKSLEMGNV